MNRGISLLGGAGLGAGFMYLFDPDRGRRRRALLRDQAARWSRKTREAAGSTARDIQNRSRGVAAAATSWIRPGRPVSDRVLAERVRSALGMAMRHPASITVEASHGVVTLRGPVLTEEATPIVSAVGRVEGVRHIDNRLDVHEEPGRIPDLQGGVGHRAGGPRFELMQANWSPTARLATALVGGAAVFYGFSRRSVSATAVAAAGLGLLLRSLTNRELARLFDPAREGEAGREDGEADPSREKLKESRTAEAA